VIRAIPRIALGRSRRLYLSPMNEIIAVVEDERDILELLTVTLEKERMRVRAFPDGGSFLAWLGKEIPAAVILDLMLPDSDGLEICRFIRKDARFQSTAVIMLTARGEETDRVTGLELGADDYVVKPFSPKELVARVKAVLRRTGGSASAPRRITVGDDLSLDVETMEVTAAGRRPDLTATEFKLLELMASRPGWIFSREKILDSLWGDEKSVTDRSVDVHIKNLREKLGPAGRHIRNIRGMGYKVVE
jgi:DNA-binding response OmpR family regulator